VTIFTLLVYICYLVFEFRKPPPQNSYTHAPRPIQTNPVDFGKARPGTHSVETQTDNVLGPEEDQSDANSVQPDHATDLEKGQSGTPPAEADPNEEGEDVPQMKLWNVILLLVAAAVCRWFTLLTVLRAKCTE